MNAQLIRDEGDPKRLTTDQLERRMAAWLAEGYVAVLFEESGDTVGYALFKEEPDWVYLRHFFVVPEHRRHGVGKAAIEWLKANPWQGQKTARLDVLIGNAAGIAFWKASGFEDHCVTMVTSLVAD